MKNKIRYYLKYGLTVILLFLVGFISLSNRYITVKAATGDVHVITNSDTFNTIKNGMVSATYGSEEYISNYTANTFVSFINQGWDERGLEGQDVLFYITSHDQYGSLPGGSGLAFVIEDYNSSKTAYNVTFEGGTAVINASAETFKTSVNLEDVYIYVWYGSYSIVDELEPMIDTNTYIYVTGVDNPVSIPDMKTAVQLTARDDIDGDLTSRIVTVSDGDYNTSVYNKTSASARTLGDYAINFSVTDNSNNTATATIVIRVVDTVKPVLDSTASKLTYTTGYGTAAITTTTILNGIVASDNYSNVTKTIVEDNYSTNATKIGSYTVKIRISDSSSNYITTTVTITVYDNVKPVITGASTFYKSYNIPKSVNDIMAFCNIVATDEIDGSMTIANGKLKILTDNYSGKANVPGTYTIILRATDVKGNYADFTITVTVGDDVIPFFLINKNKVVIESGVNLSSKMLVQALKDNGIIDNKSLSYTVYNDTYTGNEDLAGTYDYDLKVLYEDGKEEFVELEVEVLQGEEKGIQVDEEKPNIFVKIWNWIKNIFVKIWNWIKNIFSFVLLK